MKRFEYNQLYLSFTDGTNHVSDLNHFGNDGWELIASLKVDAENVLYIFKREQTTKTLLMEGKKGNE